ncbi:hypothetical protein [Spirosoma spitsbergense]|uniref:hypothetical protein n=1 Tax=Spirosoma spitsbergense TaxID=431554 RepID=UPI00036A5C42|nr:hypothetical protein [Spirosoma spitsbergense]
MNAFSFSFIVVLTSMLACTTPATDAVTPGGTTPGSPGRGKAYTTITTIAGTDTKKGFADGAGKAAQFNYPGQMTIDKNDNIYVIDQQYSYIGGSVIRKIDPAGNVTTFAKGMFSITDLCVDPRDGVTLYAIESGDARNVPNGIFRISSSGQVTRLSTTIGLPGYKDGPLAEAKFNLPQGIAMDNYGNLYIGDGLNRCIRKVNLSTSTVTTLAGKYTGDAVCTLLDGKGSEAQFCTVADLTLDEAGNLFVPDWGNNCVRKITPDGTVSTFIPLGTGYTTERPRSQAGVYQPYRIHYDTNSKQLLIVCGTGSSLYLLGTNDYLYNLGLSIVSNDYADTNPGAQHGRYGMVINRKGDIIYTDTYSHCIRKATIEWK